MTWKTILDEALTSKGTWIWTIAQTCVYMISAYLIVRQLRLQRMATMVTTLHALDQRWNSENMLEARRGACAFFGSGESNINRPEETICGFFEEISLYERKGVLPLDVVWETHSQAIEHYWAIFCPHIKKMREDLEDKTFDDQFERLNRHIWYYGWYCRLRHLQLKKPRLNIDSFIVGEQQTVAYYQQFLSNKVTAILHEGLTESENASKRA